jgi:hypothetical protein
MIDQTEAFFSQITSVWGRLGLFLLATWAGFVLGEFSGVVELNEKHEWIFRDNFDFSPGDWVAAVVLQICPWFLGVIAMGVVFAALIFAVLLEGNLFRCLSVAFSAQCLAQTAARSGIGILLAKYGDTRKLESLVPMVFVNLIVCVVLLTFALRSWDRERTT